MQFCIFSDQVFENLFLQGISNMFPLVSAILSDLVESIYTQSVINFSASWQQRSEVCFFFAHLTWGIARHSLELQRREPLGLLSSPTGVKLSNQHNKILLRETITECWRCQPPRLEGPGGEKTSSRTRFGVVCCSLVCFCLLQVCGKNSERKHWPVTKKVKNKTKCVKTIFQVHSYQFFVSHQSTRC